MLTGNFAVHYFLEPSAGTEAQATPGAATAIPSPLLFCERLSPSYGAFEASTAARMIFKGESNRILVTTKSFAVMPSDHVYSTATFIRTRCELLVSYKNSELIYNVD